MQRGGQDGDSGSHPALAEWNHSPAHSVGDRTDERHGPEIRWPGQSWTLRNSSGVSEGIDHSVIQSSGEFPYIGVAG